MRIINRIICLIPVLLLVSFLACDKSTGDQFDETFQNVSFRDIPGVTDEEIRAIEALQKQSLTFTYGSTLSTEAFMKEDGEIGGFSALFCEWLNQLFGIQFVPALYPLFELVEYLKTGVVDFTGEITPAPEHSGTYYLTDAIAERNVKMIRIEDSKSFSEIAATRSFRLALASGTFAADTVASTFEYGSFEVIFVNDSEHAYHELKNGNADAFFCVGGMEISFIAYDDVVISDYFPLVYEPVSLSTQNSAFEPIITVVQKALQNGAFTYLTELYNQGQTEYLRHTLFSRLTADERAYIRGDPIVPYVTQYRNYPMSFYDVHEKKWQGIAFQLLDEIEVLTGISFERAHGDELIRWPYLLEMVESGQAAFVTELIRTEARRGRFIWLDTTLATEYLTLVSRTDQRNFRLNEIKNLTVGVVRNTAQTEAFLRWFPNHNRTVEFDDTRDAVDALGTGELDLVMSSTSNLLVLTNYQELTGYKANMIFDKDIQESTFGFNINEVILCSIIDKALKFIDAEKISNDWRSRTFDYRYKLVEAQRPWLIGAIILLLLIFALLFILFQYNRHAGKRIKNTLEYFETIWENVEGGIVIIDLETRVVLDANPVAVSMFGEPKEKMIGSLCNRIFNVKETCQIVEENKPIIRVESQFKRSDGELIPIIKSVSKIHYNGRLVLLETFTDITHLKEAEEHKRQIMATEQANHAKSVFLANMSHEIRTPMNSIMGFSELALDGEISPKTRDYLGKIQTNAEWLLHIINDILDISKIESGKMELEHIPFNMHDLFADCRTAIMPKAVEKGIILHFYAEPSIGKIPLGDPTRLRQVLLNLLSNAVKFTNIGMIKVVSKIKDTSEKTVTVYFEIKDSGIGMTPEQIEKIFDPFMQGESDTTRKYGGTGLGLAITKNIVELMGGKLFVESTPKVGSKFSFTLTFDTIDTRDDDMFEKIAINELEKPTFEGEVLLCEDNVMNQQVICEHLARVGLKTVVAENGLVGLETVQNRMKEGEKQFDLIFMDMHMPVMDGLEAAARILELDTGIPIVAMTANIMSNDREIYRKSGINDCVGKPFTSQELWRCLMKYFKPLGWQTVGETQRVRVENELRQKLITNFVKDNRTKFGEITEAIGSGDITLAHRLAHTLKSNAGQLGKTLLLQAAANVERRLKDGENLVTPQQMVMLETELNAALAEFTPLLNEFPPEAAVRAEPFDAQSALKLIEELKPMLEMGNPECREFIDDLRRIPESEELIRQMEDLDFEPAIVTLTELKKKLEMM